MNKLFQLVIDEKNKDFEEVIENVESMRTMVEDKKISELEFYSRALLSSRLAIAHMNETGMMRGDETGIKIILSEFYCYMKVKEFCQVEKNVLQ